MKRRPTGCLRRLARLAAAAILAAFTLWLAAGVWFVHHPRRWLEAKEAAWPRLATAALLWIGNPAGDAADALGLLGEDAVARIAAAPPSGAVAYAGYPRRVAPPAPSDIRVLERGEFAVGWSPSLRHPVWCAYHVPAVAKHEPGRRPNFTKDRSAARSPASSAYARTGYDRGHMVPNYAVATRFGEDAQKATFLMSNVAPQSPALNRGVWREVEHRIADLWTARWGEVWVVVGTVPGDGETLSGSDVEVPSRFYQVVVAQDGGEVRAFAVMFEQDVPWRAWPTRYIVSIDEVECLTGLDFLPDLDRDAQDALEAAVPTRLWPVRLRDVFRLWWIHGS